MPPNGRSDTVFTASSSRCRARSRAASVRRCNRPHLATPLLEAVRPVKKPTTSYRGSVAAVTSASAADASRGLRPGTAATWPPTIEPDTSSASRSRFRRSTFPTPRRRASSRRRSRVPGSTRRGRGTAAGRVPSERREHAIGCTRARRIWSASPSCATAFAVPSAPGRRRRGSSSPGCGSARSSRSLEQGLPTSGDVGAPA